MLEVNLEHAGFEVDVFTTGESGMQALQQRSYDVVVLDHMLPGMSGVEVLAGLRDLELGHPGDDAHRPR